MGYGNDIKDTIQSAKDISEGLKQAISDAKEGKVQIGAIVRLVVLAIAWLNQIAVTFGGYHVPNVDENVIYLVATAITIAMSAYAYWKNNSWTVNAKAADAILDALQNAGITVDDVADAVGGVLDKVHTEDASGENIEENGEGDGSGE